MDSEIMAFLAEHILPEEKRMSIPIDIFEDMMRIMCDPENQPHQFIGSESMEVLNSFLDFGIGSSYSGKLWSEENA